MLGCPALLAELVTLEASLRHREKNDALPSSSLTENPFEFLRGRAALDRNVENAPVGFTRSAEKRAVQSTRAESGALVPSSRRARGKREPPGSTSLPRNPAAPRK